MRREYGIQYQELFAANFRISIRKGIIPGVLFLCFIPLFRGIANLDPIHTAQCLEESVSLLGCFLFTGLASAEEDTRILEAVCSKSVSYSRIMAVRIMMAFGALTAGIFLFSGIMAALGSRFPWLLYSAGTLVSSLLLGGTGLLAAAVADSAALGYFAAAGLWLFNMLKIAGENSPFFLFSLSDGNPIQKWLAAVLAMIEIAAVLILTRRKSKNL